MYHVSSPFGSLLAAPIPRKLMGFSDWLDTVGRAVVAQGPVPVEDLSTAELRALGLTERHLPAYELGDAHI